MNWYGFHNNSWYEYYEGTAAPMHIRKLAIETGQLDMHHSSTFSRNSINISFPPSDFIYPSSSISSQSSWFPCDENTISVTIRANVKLLASCLPVITVTGFVDTRINTDGFMPIVSASGKFNDTGTWTENMGQIVVAVVDDLEPDTAYDFSFVVPNKNEAQHPASLSIKACIDGQTCPDSGFSPLESDTTDNDASMPMAVKEIYFVERHIQQGNPLPCAANTITFTFATSVPLDMACGPLNITISGLVGTQTADTDHLQVSACTGSPAVFRAY
jgi:hypothetical protein